MTPLLELRGVSRRFGGVQAVAAVDFALHAGQLAAVIGPNGAGKTTLFNIIAGALPPSAGELHFDGASLAGVPAYRRVRLGIARSFQNLRIVPDLTVMENVLLGADALLPGGALADVLRLPRLRAPARAARAHAATLLAKVGLTRRAGDAAGSLSFGEGKLLEVARALASRPRLLLLDEPAAGLPHAEAERIAQLLRGIVAAGTTVLLVEHNMRLVMSVADQVLVLAGGRAIAAGPPATVRADPAVIEAYLGREDGDA